MRTLRSFISYILLLSCLHACTSRITTVGTGMTYSTLLSLRDGDGYCVVEVRDPWHEGRTLHTYLLVDRKARLPLPDSIRALPAEHIDVPLRRVVTLSSVHAALLYELGAGSCVAGITDTEYIISDTLRSALHAGRIADLGSSMQPDRERMAALRADALWASPYEGATTCPVDGLPYICCADYMEDTPLGRAEWMRFYGRLVGRGAEADALFRRVDSTYTALAGRMARVGNRPRVFCDLMQGDAWPMPGGHSYRARLMTDAGAEYIFADDDSRGSIFPGAEEVLVRAADAPVWLIHIGTDQPVSRSLLRRSRAVYARLAALADSGQVYECNTLRVPYYEEVPFHPDRLLYDAAAICHPELFGRPALRYYRPLQP